VNRLVFCSVALLLTACTTTGESPEEAARNTAPPGTITPYASTAQPVPPAQVAATNKAVATAALPTTIPGYTPAPPPAATLLLCPPLAKPVPRDLVQAFNVWQGTGPNTGRTLAVTVIYDPAKAPADSMIATLQPPDCPTSANGVQYIYDRQPQDRSDGWSGVLNTILTTNTQTGARSYESAYLMSKDSVLVNVVASRADRAALDPSVDEIAATTLEKVLSQLAV
jgi:hypothetical protein